MSANRRIGGRLGVFIRAKNPSVPQLQAFLGDMLADHDLLTPMRDVVARPTFVALRHAAGSGSGALARDALLQDIARLYLPGVIEGVRQILDGLLDQPSVTNGSSGPLPIPPGLVSAVQVRPQDPPRPSETTSWTSSLERIRYGDRRRVQALRKQQPPGASVWRALLDRLRYGPRGGKP